MRKIIQISAIPAFDANDSGTFCNNETLYALCDDGSVFYMTMGRELEWTDVPPIPQDTDEQKPASPQRDVSP